MNRFRTSCLTRTCRDRRSTSSRSTPTTRSGTTSAAIATDVSGSTGCSPRPASSSTPTRSKHMSTARSSPTFEYYGYGVSSFTLSLHRDGHRPHRRTHHRYTTPRDSRPREGHADRGDRALSAHAGGPDRAGGGVSADADHQGRPAAPDLEARTIRPARLLPIRRSRQPQDVGCLREHPVAARPGPGSVPDDRQFPQVRRPADRSSWAAGPCTCRPRSAGRTRTPTCRRRSRTATFRPRPSTSSRRSSGDSPSVVVRKSPSRRSAPAADRPPPA